MTNFFFRNPRLVVLTIGLILVSGLSSLMILPRIEDPVLVGRGALIHTLYPGADPQRVEALVTEPIEDELSDLIEIKEISSGSRESVSTILIELRDDVLDGEPVWTKIRDRLEDVQSELPAGALAPQFEEIDFKAFAMLVGLRWQSETPVSYAVLHRWAKQLQDRLQDVNGTEKTKWFGQPEEEVLVSLDSNQLAALGLTVADVSNQIAASDAKVAAGQIRSQDQDLLIELAGELDTIARIESIPIRYRSQAGFVPLSNIAKVEKRVVDPPDSLAFVAGQPAVVLGVYVRSNDRIDLWTERIKTVLAEFEEALPAGVALELMFTQNDYVSHRLATLTNNLLLGGAAVFVVILLMMGWRNAIVVSFALPLAVMMVLFTMRLLGIPIHQMSVTGMIIALGLLIDNAIVIVEEITIRLRRGSTTDQAVSSSVRHLFLPLFGSTLTTALAFAPIALMPGPAGEFVGAIAINVIVAIFSSFFLAMTVIPAIAAWSSHRQVTNPTVELISRSGSRQQTVITWWQNGFSNARLTAVYAVVLDFFFRRPWLGVFVGAVLPVLGLAVASQLPEQFFPSSDRDQLHIELELSPQSSLAATVETTQAIRDELLADSDVTRVDWFIGESAPAFYYNVIPRRSNVSQYAQAMVHLRQAGDSSTTIQRLQNRLDQKFAHARTLVRQLEQGPPFDAPVEVRLFGPDLQRLRELGEQLRTLLVDTPGVLHTRCDMDAALPGVTLDINEENVRAAGMSLADVALQLNAATEGMTGGSILETTEELPVRVRLDTTTRSSLQNLVSLQIVNPRLGSESGSESQYDGVPISAIADVKLTSEFGTITHFSNQRMNEIQVFIPAGVLPSTVLTEFQRRLEASDFQLPPGYQLKYGGESAKRNEAVTNLMASVGILLVMMVAALVLSFGSFRMATIVGVVGGLSIGLGMLALWWFGFPFGFMAIIGSMGLMGVAINDTIVVLAALRDNEGAVSGDQVATRAVVIQSTRHIISTSLTTMAGFAPLIISGGSFWPPLAIAIAGGVSGATILALIFAPSLHLILMCRSVQNG